MAIGPETVLLVQVKSNGWAGPSERGDLESFPAPYIAIKQIWRWDDGAGEPRIAQFCAGEQTWDERGKIIFAAQCEPVAIDITVEVDAA